MSILKMKFVNIVGINDYIDDFAYNYIVDSNIQLENAMSVLENVKGLSPYIEENPYTDLIKRSTSLLKSMEIMNEVSQTAVYAGKVISSPVEIRRQLNELEQELQAQVSNREDLKDRINEITHIIKQLELLENIDVDLERFFNFEFIKFRFGRMPKKNYKQLQLYLDDLEVIVIPVSQDQDSVWMLYFTPRVYGEKIDGIFSSLYFERTRISGELKGKPSNAMKLMKVKSNLLQAEYKKSGEDLDAFMEKTREKAVQLYYSCIRLNRIFEVKKYAAHTAESFYIIGWIPEDDLNAIAPELGSDEKIIYIEEDPDMIRSIQPPTQLKNNRIFRPFETLVRMYGLPSYNEIDPTAFVAVTYFIMFGFMFGDVGQGLVLFGLGMLLLRMKVNLGGVIIGAGISSTLFGFLYGSVFGFEHWIPTLWMKPMENINTMLIVGISAGVVLITIAIVLNVVNGIKSRDIARILLDKNGIAGFAFYWGVILFVLYFIKTGKPFISIGFMIICILVPILVMFLKEPLENLIHRKKVLPNQKGMFFVQTFFELFDTVLSFVSNTISFIRLSAFALNHAGLFLAVLILSGMSKGLTSLIEIILGNILIIGLEGLIVGIQALRLEYYELFSRFFSGDGRPYKPLKNQTPV